MKNEQIAWARFVGVLCETHAHTAKGWIFIILMLGVDEQANSDWRLPKNLLIEIPILNYLQHLK